MNRNDNSEPVILDLVVGQPCHTEERMGYLGKAGREKDVDIWKGGGGDKPQLPLAS